MKKWLISIILVVFVAALAACGNGDQADTTKDSKKKVVMWGSWSGDQIDQLKKQIKEYNQSQDKYEVSYVMQKNVEEKLLTSIAGGEVPDLIMWDRYQTQVYADKNVLQPIDDLVKKDKIKTTDFYQEALQEMTHNDKLYGLPILNDTRVMFYNKKLLKKAEVKAPTNWKEVEEVAKKTTKWQNGKLKQAGLSLQDVGLFNVYLLQAGGQLISDDEKEVAYNSKQGLEVLKYWDQLQNKDKVYERGFDDGNDQFAAGKEAMILNGPWALADYDKVKDLDYGLVEPPKGPNGDQGAIMGGFGLVMPKQAKNQAGAWDFMKWWATKPENSVKFAKISGWLPANKKAANDDYFTKDPNYSVFVKAMNYAKIRPTVKNYSNIENLALTPQLEKFMNGDISAEKALGKAETEGNKLLKK